MALEGFDFFRCAILAASQAAISMVVHLEANGFEARLWELKLILHHSSWAPVGLRVSLTMPSAASFWIISNPGPSLLGSRNRRWHLTALRAFTRVRSEESGASSACPQHEAKGGKSFMSDGLSVSQEGPPEAGSGR